VEPKKHQFRRCRSRLGTTNFLSYPPKTPEKAGIFAVLIVALPCSHSETGPVRGECKRRIKLIPIRGSSKENGSVTVFLGAGVGTGSCGEVVRTASAGVGTGSCGEVVGTASAGVALGSCGEVVGTASAGVALGSCGEVVGTASAGVGTGSCDEVVGTASAGDNARNGAKVGDTPCNDDVGLKTKFRQK